MKWFEGSIADAVTTSKTNNAIFVVFIKGKDDASKILLSALDKSEISKNLESSSFVSVMLESGSESHNQFSEIYKLVPVPSVFFIGQNGAPLEIVPGETSEETVVGKLQNAISKCTGSSTSTPKAPPDNCIKEKPGPSQSSPPEEASPSDINTSIPTVSENKADSPSTPPNTPEENTKMDKDKVAELLEKKKEERKAQEERDEKEREVERRKMGQTLMEVKRKQQERELEDLKNERIKEKQEDKIAKQKVLEQIAQDRADRAARMAITQPSVPPPPTLSPGVVQPRASSPTDSNIARLQFRMPDGQTRTHSFPADTTLGQVRQFIDNNMVLPFREYQMATTFPRREFTFRDIDTNLRDLELLPTAVILVMPLQGNTSLSRGTGWSKMMMKMFWDLVQPLISLSNYIQNLIWGRRGDNSGPSSQRRDAPSSAPRYPPSQTAASRSTVRKRGNVHSLADNDNSNDENNTWNGNSTQQM